MAPCTEAQALVGLSPGRDASLAALVTAPPRAGAPPTEAGSCAAGRGLLPWSLEAPAPPGSGECLGVVSRVCVLARDLLGPCFMWGLPAPLCPGVLGSLTRSPPASAPVPVPAPSWSSGSGVTSSRRPFPIPRNPTERAHWVPEPHMASTLPALPLLRPPLPPVVCSQKAGWGRRHRARGPAPVRARPALTDGVVAPMREDMSLVPNRTWCGDCPWGLHSGPVLGRLTLQRLWPPTSRPRWVPQTGCCCWLGLASEHGALNWPPPSWGFTVTLAHLPSTHSCWPLPESPAG